MFVNGPTGYESGKLPIYPSPKPTLTLPSHLGQNVGLGEGKVDSFPEKYNDPEFLGFNSRCDSYLFFLCHARDVINISFSSGNALFAAISFEFNKFIPDLKEKTSVTRNMSIITGSTAWYLNGIGGSNLYKKKKKKKQQTNKTKQQRQKTFSCSLEQFLKSLFSETIMPLFNLLDVHPGRLNS